MDKEGQDPSSAVVFNSANIGDKATPEYFSNIEGGKKDKTKVRKRMTRQTRKTLLIILGVVIALLFVIVMIFVIMNIANSHKYGERTEQELPTTSDDIEQRTYDVVYRDENGGYREALIYLNNLIMDMVDSGSNANLIFAARAFRAKLAYEAGGGSQLGIQEALKLEESAETERQKYIIYSTLANLYYREGNLPMFNYYSSMTDDLDVEENKIETYGTTQADDEDPEYLDEENEDEEN